MKIVKYTLQNGEIPAKTCTYAKKAVPLCQILKTEQIMDNSKDFIMERILALDERGWYVVGQTLADIRQCCVELPFKPKPNKDYVPSDFLHYLNEVEKHKEVLTKSEIKIQILAILDTMYHMNDGFTPDPYGLNNEQ